MLRRVASRALLVCAACALALAIAEIVLRMTWAGANRYYIWPPNLSMTFRPTPGVMAHVGPEAHIWTNSQGVRGREVSPNRATEYRILAIGGSTTECLYLDQERAWPAVLGDELAGTGAEPSIWVGNLGRAGYNTRDHLAFMRFLLDDYDVDAIVMLVGANDMLLPLREGPAYDPHFIDDDDRYWDWLRPRFAVTPVGARNDPGRIDKQTALWRLKERIKSSLTAHSAQAPIVQDSDATWLIRARQQHAQATSLIDAIPVSESALAEYDRNIEAIVDEAQRRSVRLILLTQPAIWKSQVPAEEAQVLWQGFDTQGNHFTAGAMARAMQMYNDHLLNDCARLHAECFDLAGRIPRSLESFYDDMHFNELGARKVADELSSYFQAGPPFVMSAQ